VITPNADILCLAGDIGIPASKQYHEFIAKAHAAFKHVIVIAGNHEYWRSVPNTMEETDAYIRQLCRQYPNVHYLTNGENVVIDDLNFIGATLWSRINPAPRNQVNWSDLKMRTDVPMSVERHNALFKSTLDTIAKAINASTKKNIIVTHHAPLLDGPFSKPDPERDCLYGTDLSYAIGAPHIHAWFFGHTHYNFMTVMKGTLVASNQYGACSIRGWNKAFSVTV